MSNYTRRDMLKILSAAGLVSSGFGMSRAAFGASAAHIVIVGGGIGGIATAKYLRIINDQVKITVIEPSSKYTFCPGSNEVLTGMPISDFERSYDHTMKRYNFNMVASKVEDIDFNDKVVKTAAGDTIKYDTLVISTGPDFIFDNIEGYSKELAETKILHAWKAGIQTTMLRDQIAAMPDGGTLVIAPPGMPFRCPPAPYERASFVAEHMKKQGKKGKIMILDNNVGFIFQKQYMHYWKEHYGFGTDNAMIEWVSGPKGGAVSKVDAKAMTVTTKGGETIKADVINIIPTHTANALTKKTGLTSGDWVKTNKHDMTALTHPDVHVIGDTADFFVKTGYLASNQAKVVAQAIDDRLHDRAVGQPIYTNNCIAKASEDNFGMAITDSFRERDGKLILQQTVQRPFPESYSNEFLHHIRAKVSDNWQRSFRRAIFD